MMYESLFHQTDCTARFEFGPEAARQLAPLSDWIVVIDVMSFSTCIDVAVSHGATVFPYRYKDESANAYAASMNAVLAGKRGEVPSLSPFALSKIEPGLRLVLPSQNGAMCTVAAQEAGCQVIAASLRNASAVARFLNEQPGVVTVIGCGERWDADDSLRPAFEDLVGAGAILSRLTGRTLSPEAQMAVAAYHAAAPDLKRLFRECSSGRELICKGFPEDVEMASDLDASSAVPLLKNGAF